MYNWFIEYRADQSKANNVIDNNEKYQFRYGRILDWTDIQASPHYIMPLRCQETMTGKYTIGLFEYKVDQSKAGDVIDKNEQHQFR